MRAVIFCHSLLSDWNHGNAHFLRGITTELMARGVDVDVYEPAGGWSIRNLRADFGERPILEFKVAHPHLSSIAYDAGTLVLERALDGADLVLVHEWNEPSLVARIGEHRRRHPGYCLLFHDTHHRSVTAPHELDAYELDNYDGVLAFGASVAEQYRKRGWANRVWVWHEAADQRVFRPRERNDKLGDLVWIGNWGDGERTAELHEYLIDPVRELKLRACVHGVRYPETALQALREAGIRYGGWVANYRVPFLFARFRFTVHVPRRPYAEALPGVPTIRVFEALACGIPLISAPWHDAENLFTPGEDFLFAHSGEEMRYQMRALLEDPERARALAEHGRATILNRHTCAHRVSELMAICSELGIADCALAAAEK